VTETARVLLTALVLSGVALTAFVWRLSRPGRAGHEYLVDQLKLSQLAGLLLSAVGGAGIGLAVAGAAAQGAFLEAAAGIVTLGAGVLVLRRETVDALLLAGTMFLLHAAFAWFHRPAFIAGDVVPRWYAAGVALFDVYTGALCLLARRARPR